jgi:membrane-associated phospholipid phosphatase
MFTTTSKEKLKYTMAALWKWKSFFQIISFASFLIILWLLPTTHSWIEKFDKIVFFKLNSLISKYPYWQTFWVMANHYYSNDLVFDAIIIGFAFVHIFKSPKHLTARKLAEILFTIIITVLTILLVHRLLMQEIFSVHRKSPVLLNPLNHMLSEITSWINIRTKSKCSFPSGHGTSALLFVFSCFILMGPRKGLLSLFFGLYLMLPRVIIGGHWLSDILFGSLPIALIVVAFCFYTPFFHQSIRLFEKLIYKCAPKLNPTLKKSSHEK